MLSLSKIKKTTVNGLPILDFLEVEKDKTGKPLVEEISKEVVDSKVEFLLKESDKLIFSFISQLPLYKDDERYSLEVLQDSFITGERSLSAIREFSIKSKLASFLIEKGHPVGLAILDLEDLVKMTNPRKTGIIKVLRSAGYRLLYKHNPMSPVCRLRFARVKQLLEDNYTIFKHLSVVLIEDNKMGSLSENVPFSVYIPQRSIGEITGINRTYTDGDARSLFYLMLGIEGMYLAVSEDGINNYCISYMTQVIRNSSLLSTSVDKGIPKDRRAISLRFSNYDRISHDDGTEKALLLKPLRGEFDVEVRFALTSSEVVSLPFRGGA